MSEKNGEIAKKIANLRSAIDRSIDFKHALDQKDAESAQLREEVERLKRDIEDFRHGNPTRFKAFLERRDAKIASQSLLIEKLSYALANVMLTIEALNMSVKNELHPDLKKAIADNVSIGREVLALLPQDEKREGK